MNAKISICKEKAFKAYILIFFFLIAFVMAACSSPTSLVQQATPTAQITSSGPTPTPKPLGMVDVGGYELFFDCIGQGTPTVIL